MNSIMLSRPDEYGVNRKALECPTYDTPTICDANIDVGSPTAAPSSPHGVNCFCE
jgi:hypothetical protein